MFPTETYSPPKCVFWGFPPLAHRHPHPVHSSFYLAVASQGLPQAPPLKASNWKIWFANDIDLWNVVPD